MAPRNPFSWKDQVPQAKTRGVKSRVQKAMRSSAFTGDCLVPGLVFLLYKKQQFCKIVLTSTNNACHGPTVSLFETLTMGGTKNINPLSDYLKHLQWVRTEYCKNPMFFNFCHSISTMGTSDHCQSASRRSKNNGYPLLVRVTKIL